MSEPIVVEIPHKLGLAGARARVDGGIGKLAGMFPGGAAVDHRPRLDAFGQQGIGTGLDVGFSAKTTHDSVLVNPQPVRDLGEGDTIVAAAQLPQCHRPSVE